MYMHKNDYSFIISSSTSIHISDERAWYLQENEAMFEKINNFRLNFQERNLFAYYLIFW